MPVIVKTILAFVIAASLICIGLP